MFSREYEGEHKSGDDGMANLQTATVGEVLDHDCFGECTLLSEPARDAGSFMVMVHDDRQIRELTRGHFQFQQSREPSNATRQERLLQQHLVVVSILLLGLQQHS
eukprot:6186595-Pleurochrysis_carterae.AAC.1